VASPKDLDLVRRTYDAFNRRDMDTILAGFHPDAEWHPILADLGGGVYRGHDGIRTMLEEIDETWDAFQSDVQDVVDAGDDLVFVFTRSQGRGKASGVTAELSVVTVVEMRDGRGARVWSYASLEDALAAAGLERLPAAAGSVGRGG
jgi:ketosteroid isomerase-like protein